MLNTIKLQQFIVKIKSSDTSISEWKLFLKYWVSLATAFLYSRMKASRFNLEYSISNEAPNQQCRIDSVADLFPSDNRKKLIKLFQYFEPLILQLENIQNREMASGDKGVAVDHASTDITSLRLNVFG